MCHFSGTGFQVFLSSGVWAYSESPSFLLISIKSLCAFGSPVLSSSDGRESVSLPPKWLLRSRTWCISASGSSVSAGVCRVGGSLSSRWRRPPAALPCSTWGTGAPRERLADTPSPAFCFFSLSSLKAFLSSFVLFQPVVRDLGLLKC